MSQAGIRHHCCPSSLDPGAWQCRLPVDLLPAGVQRGAGDFQRMAFHPNPWKPKDG